MKRIGIIGGAGPEAGSLLFKKIIRLFQAKGAFKKIIRLFQAKGAWQDHEFPFIMLLNVPFAPMLINNENEKDIVQQLQNAVDILEQNNVDFIVIACNTLHSFIKNVVFKKAQFISLIKTTEELLKDSNADILFVGTTTSKSALLYSAIKKLRYPSNSQQHVLIKIISEILAGTIKRSHIEELEKLVNSFDCDQLLLGCTEFSVLVEYYPMKKPLIDPLENLAKRIFELAQ